MTSDWKECTLEQISTILGDGLHGTPKYSINGKYAFINGNNLSNGKIIIKSDTKRVDKCEYEKYKKDLNNRTLLVSINGTLGNIAEYNEEKIILGKSACYFNVKENIDKYFIKYILLSKTFQDYLNNQATGTTIKNISLKQMREYNFLLPPLETQQKIAKILSAIDDKIELNNSINNNLEQQAQAIFKSWFVDFEPFGGTMPKEWTKRTLDEFCSIFTGRKNANQFEENGENKFFTCGPNPLKINSYIYDGPAIIISGNGAYTGRTRFYNGKFDLYQRTYACTMLENIDSDYIYLLYIIIKNVLQDKIMGGTHGSAIPYIVMNDIAKFELFYNNEIFKDLSQIMKSIVNEIMHNELENEQLAQLRDTLLPKLMSGEIDVSKVEIDDILGNQSADKLLFSEEKS